MEPTLYLGGLELFARGRVASCRTEYCGLFARRPAAWGTLQTAIGRVWAARVEPPDWLDRESPERRALIEALAAEFPRCDLRRPTVFGGDFLAHRSVAAGLQQWYWRAYGLSCAKFGEPDEALLRRLCGIWFCMRDDLELLPIGAPWVKDGAQPTVSIIVTARNYGRFLYDCLSSCLKQSVQPLEVIYCDDASQDESLSVARRFRAVDVLACPKHVGVVAARNRAAEASRGEVLIHVDGDDQLPSSFVERHLAALAASPSAPFAYGPAQAFGLQNCLWPAPQWGELTLWEQNFCNSSSAIRRWAFQAAGGWRENPSGTLWDWDLFLRAARLGRPARSEATLLYRQHRASWSHHGDERSAAGQQALLGKVRRHLARLSVGCVFSGRLPKLLPLWLKALADNCRAAGVSPDLTVLDDSRRGLDKLRRAVRPFEQSFAVVRLIPLPERTAAGRSELERRDGLSRFLADAYGRLLAEAAGDLLLWLEDDVVLPRAGLDRLLSAATAGLPLPGAVAGCYQNRHTGAGYVSGWLEQGSVRQIDRCPNARGTLPVDVTGSGCLLFWRELAPPTVESHLPLAAGPCAAHDWAFTAAIRRSGRQVLLLPGVRCRHHRTLTEWI